MKANRTAHFFETDLNKYINGPRLEWDTWLTFDSSLEKWLQFLKWNKVIDSNKFVLQHTKK